MTSKLPPPARSNAAGSPLPGEPAFLAVGKLRHAHGVRGEILMEVYTDFPERLQPGTVLFLGEAAVPLTLLKCRSHHAGLLLTLQGYDSPEAVGQLRNQLLFVRTNDRPMLREGEYYHHQLIGLKAVSEAGEVIGSITEILETGASDVLVIQSEFKPELLVPVTDAFVKKIDLDQRIVTIDIIPGMRGEED